MKPVHSIAFDNGKIQLVTTGVRFEKNDDFEFRGGVFCYQPGFKRRRVFESEAIFICGENAFLYRMRGDWHCVKMVFENGYKAIFEITANEAASLRTRHGEDRYDLTKIIFDRYLRHFEKIFNVCTEH